MGKIVKSIITRPGPKGADGAATLNDANINAAATTLTAARVRTDPGVAGSPFDLPTIGPSGPVWQRNRIIDVTHPSIAMPQNGVTGGAAQLELAIQMAIAVQGTVYLPKPTNAYIIERTVVVRPASGPQGRFDMVAAASFGDMFYTGASGTAVFDLRGTKFCSFTNIQVRVQNRDNVTVWDMVNDVTYLSMGLITWTGCHVFFDTSTACTGWRSRETGGLADNSFVTWIACTVQGDDLVTGDGHIGWHNVNPNCTQWVWYNSGASAVHHQISNHARYGALNGALTSGAVTMTLFETMQFPSAGVVKIGTEKIAYTGRTATTLTGLTRGSGGTVAAAHDSAARVSHQTPDATYDYGGSSMEVNDMGGSFNQCDFNFGTGGPYKIHGGRWELGNRFLQTGTTGAAVVTVGISNVHVDAYDPSDGVIFAFGMSTWLQVVSSQFAREGVALFDTNFIRSSGWGNTGGGYDINPAGSVVLENVAINAADTNVFTLGTYWRFWTVQASIINNDTLTTHVMHSPRISTHTGGQSVALYEDVIKMGADPDSGAMTTYLLTAVGNTGKEYIFRRSSAAGNATVAVGGGGTINGALTRVIGTQNGVLHVQSDGTEWIIVGQVGTIT